MFRLVQSRSEAVQDCIQENVLTTCVV